MKPLRIVSGGQTGVDRAALDAALDAGLPCGGWCPRGRRAEDGTIPERYPLAETAQADYAVRTRRNVEDSDATLIFCCGELGGGTALTASLCESVGRPLLVVDAHGGDVDAAAGSIAEFLSAGGHRTLNVAGPRASEAPAAGTFAAAVLACLLVRESS